MSAAFQIVYLGNASACRTEAEVSLRHSPRGTDPLCALVHETEAGTVVEWFGVAKENSPRPGLIEAVEEAKRGLLEYPNRRGANVPEGLTRAGLSLWLLAKSAGAA